jgi:thioredoxin-related protein
MKKNVILFLVVVLFQISCSFNNNSKKPVELKPTQKEILNLGNSISLVQIETTNDCMLNSIDKTYFDEENNRLVVLSNFNLFFFDAKGKYINKLTVGNGPGEILQVVSFTANSKQKRVYAIDRGNTVIVLDYNGNFIKRLSLDKFYSIDIICNNDTSIFLLGVRTGGHEKSFVGLYSITSEKMVGKYVASSQSNYPLFLIITAQNFTKRYESIYFSSTNIFGLFEFKDNDFNKIFSCNLVDNEVPTSFTEKYIKNNERNRFSIDAKENGYIPFICYAFRYKDYYLVSVDNDERSCYAISVNDTQKVYYCGTIACFFGLPNLKSLNFIKGIQDDMITFSVNPLEFFNDNELSCPKNIEIGGLEICVKHTDNPILIVIK